MKEFTLRPDPGDPRLTRRVETVVVMERPLTTGRPQPGGNQSPSTCSSV